MMHPFFFFPQPSELTIDFVCVCVFLSRVSKEIQSVSQQLQNCLANPAGTSANMKLLQKSLGRPLPFKVWVLRLQKIWISTNVKIYFHIIINVCNIFFSCQHK